MRKQIIILTISVIITALAAACGANEVSLSNVAGTEAVIGTESVTGNDASEATVDMQSAAVDDVTANTAGTFHAEGGTDAEGSTSTTDETVYVYVCGEVVTPGVYALRQGARIYEAVTLAGGLTQDADDTVINQAQTVTDGMMIRIPAAGSEEAEDALAAQSAGQVVTSDGSMLVDINTADVAALTTLPGIGESKAAAIIAYRQENGGFKRTEDITNVSGIGDSTYERLRSLITVTP